MKRVISVIIILSLLFSALCIGTFAEEETCPVRIEIVSDKTKHKKLDIADFKVTVTNVGEYTLENVSVNTECNSLKLHGNDNTLSAEVQKLEPQESVELKFRATVSFDSVSIFAKLILMIKTWIDKTFKKSTNSFAAADIRESTEQNQSFSFGKVNTSVKVTAQYNTIIPEPPVVEKNGYSVSTSSEYATRAAVQVLEAGGNAVDAAIAAAYTLSVTEPFASGLGGGGGMLVYDPKTEDFNFLNYLSETAASGTVEYGIEVPGFVSGMQKAYDMYGTMPFADLLASAVECAENGFIVNEYLGQKIAEMEAFNTEVPFTGKETGDTLVQSELAEIIKTIIEKGSDDFYNGSIAEKIVSGTTFTADDLARYETIVSKPVSADFAGCTIISAPSPFSGVMLIQMLKMLEMKGTPNPSDDPLSYINDFVAFKSAALSERTKLSGDPRFYAEQNNEYVTHITDEYIYGMLNTEYEQGEEEDAGDNTTHVSIIDSDGMTVSMTNTVASFWGAKYYSNGIVFNDSMRCFGEKGINKYEPAKRPRSFMVPTIIVDNEHDSILAAGSPGGKVIPTAVAQVLADIYLYGVDKSEAVEKQRIMVKEDNSVLAEIGFGTAPRVDFTGLDFKYTKYSKNDYFGCVNIAELRGGEYSSVADRRRYGFSIANNE